MNARRASLPTLILIPAIVLAIATPVAAQNGVVQIEMAQSRANWALAEKFSSEAVGRVIHSTSVRDNWIHETDSLWYEWTDNEGTRFHLVVPSERSNTPLFDHERMAARLTEELGVPHEAHNLELDDLEFAEDGLSFEFEVEVESEEDDVHFRYHLDDGTLENLGVPEEEEEEEEEREWREFAPDSTAYVYAEGHNLYLVEIVDGVEQEAIQLTIDGEEDYSFGSREAEDFEDDEDEFDPDDPTEYRVPSNAEWSDDSQAFYVRRGDSRGIEGQELWVIDVLAEPRPELRTYGKRLGGEPVPYGELHVYRRGETSLTELDMVHRWKDQSLGDIHFGTTSDRLRMIRRDRMWQKLDLIEVDLNTLEVRALVSEALEWSTLEGGSGFGNRYEPRYIEDGGDFLWWSERTGWGHFYLYDYDGNLKHAVTSGSWRAAELAQVDSIGRTAWIVGLGREPGENPYYEHIYRTNLDNPSLTLLNPGDYDHNASLSGSRNYLLDTYSRVDTPPRSVIRDGNGEIVMELEALDVTPLEEMGWSPAEPFTVKSADGVTNIYGNMWKPFDLDPERTYPIIASVYPGPQTESVSTGFSANSGLQRLAQLGFIVIQIGNRGGSPHRSAAYKAHSYQDLRDYGLADKKAGIEQLAARHPFIDATRVGIFGHSGGGFMTGAALLVPPYNEFFTVGVASNGNHDNNVYSDYWAEQNHGLQYECVELETVTEESMEGESLEEGMPGVGGARRAIPGDGYCEPNERVEWVIEVPSNGEVAENLQGHLLLAFSDQDNNVHPANTIRLVRALVDADKRFDIVMIPGRAHGFGPDSRYFQRRRDEYFAEHLLGDSYRGQADIRY